MDDDDLESDENLPLYHSASITMKNFSLILILFAQQHNISDNAVNNLLEIFKTILPKGNRCPTSAYKLNKIAKQFEHKNSHYQLCSKCHTNIENSICTNTTCEMQNLSMSHESTLQFYIFDVKSQLERIITGKH